METHSINRRKMLAVLGGGLVLGVGAALTLASWNDSEFASGTFGAGSFNLEGSTTSATADFTENTELVPATLGFTLPLADDMAPEDVVYAPFWVRLDAGTTTPANLAATGVTASEDDNADYLSYTVYAIAPGATCNASAATGGTLLASGDDLADFTAGGTVALTIGAAEEDAGTPVQLCFAVTAETGIEQGESGTATWQFTATSD